MSTDWTKALISSGQLTTDVVQEILSVCDRMRALCDARGRSPLLADRIVALIFLEPSSRTMLSFQAAAQRLGAGVLFMHGKEQSSLAKGESLSDTMRMVAGYADLVVARLPETGAAAPAAAACAVPFINAGDGANEHPTQALIDVYTIRRQLGTLEGLHFACGFDPRHSRTIHSFVRVLSQYRGNSFVFVAPDGLEVPHSLQDMLVARNVHFRTSTDMAAMRDADVLYLNRLQAERFADQAAFDHVRSLYSLTPEMLSPKNRLVLDPLPRVGEIAESVDALPVAGYFAQAHDGVPVRMALLSLMMGRSL